MKRLALAAAFAVTAAAPAIAQDGAEDGAFVVKPSAHSVTETLDRLEALLEERGIAVAARIDHAANAAGVDLDLPDTQLLVFGNPKLGTPLMQSERLIGLDLPMKVLAYETEDGVRVAYTAPQALAERHGLDGMEPIGTMTGALDALTDAATAE